MKHILYIFLILLMFNCKNEEKTISANEIVNKSIEISGGDQFANSVITFDFRDKHYSAKRKQGQFALERLFINNADTVQDVLTNSGFKRIINGKQVAVVDSMIPKYEASVNSVHYFSVLPFGLNDMAVKKELIGETRIKDKDYYKVKVTFNEDGGGEDFEDVFIYWINTETFKTNYLAYSYEEPHGKGLRFREAYNERLVNGLQFVDYNNYKPLDVKASLYELDKLFESDELKLLSKIELKNVNVTILD